MADSALSGPIWQGLNSSLTAVGTAIPVINPLALSTTRRNAIVVGTGPPADVTAGLVASLAPDAERVCRRVSRDDDNCTVGATRTLLKPGLNRRGRGRILPYGRREHTQRRALERGMEITVLGHLRRVDSFLVRPARPRKDSWAGYGIGFNQLDFAAPRAA